MPDYNYRLATHPQSGDHGYEIGYWPDGADLSDPAQYHVISVAMSQQEAAAQAVAWMTQPPQSAEDAEPTEEGDHYIKHKRATHKPSPRT